MKLIIVRHGETIENKNRIFQGQADGTLSELGLEQVKKLALRLKNEKIDIIYSSDLGRALNTAKEIAKYHPETEIKIDQRLRERLLGQDEGKTMPKNFNWFDLKEDAETNLQLFNRVKEFIEEVYINNKDKTVLASTHGGVILAALSYFHNDTYKNLDNYSPIPNTAVSIVEFEEDGNHKVLLKACDKHLE